MVAPGRMLIRSAADPERLRVESSREMEGWRARQPATPTRPWMPGTAIEVEGVEGLWEVVAATPRGTGVVYDLAPWPEGLVMRAVLPFSAAACQAEARERRGRARRDQARFAQLLAAPLLGLLPADLQRRLEARQTYSAVRGTIISAALLFAPAFVFTLAGLYEALACATGRAESGGWALRSYPWSPFLLFDSGIRIMFAWIFSEPFGSLPVVVVVGIGRAVERPFRRLFGGPVESAATRRRRELNTARQVAALRDDEVRELGDGELEVLSILPKPHWTPTTLIRFRGRGYGLAGSESPPVAAVGREPHRFLLREAPPEDSFASAVDYDPSESRLVARRLLHSGRESWVRTLAPLWGLLAEPVQRRLEAAYGHEPLRATGHAVIATGALAAAGIITTPQLLAAGEAGAGDALLFGASLLLAAESAYRFHAFRAGRIVPSVLGHLVAPLARRLLRF